MKVPYVCVTWVKLFSSKEKAINITYLREIPSHIQR